MRIVSSKQIEFLVSNIFEKYYGPIQEELLLSGLEEELDDMAITIINEHLALCNN